MSHIKTLTGLRGVAALIVFISHAANENLLPSILGNGFGQTGVIIFFMLSGFLMTYLYLDKEFTLINVKYYIVARVGRVFPLYLFLILFSLIMVLFIDSEFYYKFGSKIQVIQALLFIKAPYVFWTIPVEVQFYGLFLLFWYAHKKNITPIFLFGGALITIVPSIIYIAINGDIPKIISTYSFSFFVGIVTSFYFKRIQKSNFISKVPPKIPFVFFILLFINLPEVRHQYSLNLFDDLFMKTWLDPLTWLIIYPLFIFTILDSPSLNFLNNNLFKTLGNISYGFYLMHYPILMYVKILKIGDSFKLLLAFSITFLLAYISNRIFERYANRKVKQLFI